MSVRNPRVECEFHGEIPFSDVPFKISPLGPPEERQRQRPSQDIRGPKLNANVLLSTFWATPGHPSKHPRISLQKDWFLWVSRDIPNF